MEKEQIPRWIVSTLTEEKETSVSSHYWITARILFDTALDDILRKGRGGRVRVAHRNAEGEAQPVIEATLYAMPEE